MIVCPAGNQTEAAFEQSCRQGFGIGNDLLLVSFELWRERLFQGNRFGSNHMHEWSPLISRKYRRVYALRQIAATHDHATTWTSQRLMSGRRDNLGIGNGRWMEASGNE